MLRQAQTCRSIQKLLGHTSSKTPEIYAHESKKAINKIQSQLARLDLSSKNYKLPRKAIPAK